MREPESGVRAEIAGETDGGVGRNIAPRADDFRQAIARHADGLTQRAGAQVERREIFLAEDFAGMCEDAGHVCSIPGKQLTTSASTNTNTWEMS
jgi:hypothetical protein